MTRNQLAYWELRWKQHYDKLYIEETKRANLAKESETERHNKAQERIANTQNVLRSMEIAIQKGNLEKEWARLEQTKLADTMSWLFEAQKLDQQERRLKADIEDLLAKREIAIAELTVTAQHNMNQDFAKMVEANTKALQQGWGKGAAAIGLGAIESLPGIANYTKTIDELKSKLGIVQETKLQVGAEYLDQANKTQAKAKSYADEAGKFEAKASKSMIETYGPRANSRAGVQDKFGNKIANPSEATYVHPAAAKGIKYDTPIGPEKPNVATSSGVKVIDSGTSFTRGPGAIHI